MSEEVSIPDPHPRVLLGHASGISPTKIGFGFDPGSDDLQTLLDADPEALNPESRVTHAWAMSLPDKQRPYFYHLKEIAHEPDGIWPAHRVDAAPPAWVACPGHPALEQAIADHYTARGHVCAVGEPE